MIYMAGEYINFIQSLKVSNSFTTFQLLFNLVPDSWPHDLQKIHIICENKKVALNGQHCLVTYTE